MRLLDILTGYDLYPHDEDCVNEARQLLMEGVNRSIKRISRMRREKTKKQKRKERNKNARWRQPRI